MFVRCSVEVLYFEPSLVRVSHILSEGDQLVGPLILNNHHDDAKTHESPYEVSVQIHLSPNMG